VTGQESRDLNPSPKGEVGEGALLSMRSATLSPLSPFVLLALTQTLIVMPAKAGIQ
jgi:hypothetical protein